MTSEEPTESPDTPSLPWRIGSGVVMGLTGFLSRSFLLAGNRLTVHGLDEFLELLDERRDVDKRQRGLITVSNHLSILDDPLMWGALPYKYHWNPSNHRWGLGSHDLMFKRRSLCTFFSLGQCIPTHRLAHSPDGGPFQPTITQVIRLLSHPAKPLARSSPSPTNTASNPPPSPPTHPEHSIPDPFTHPNSPYFYSSPQDPYAYPTPTRSTSLTNPHARTKYGWLHIFPEGRIHQHPLRYMRYHKWGIGRIILETDPAPLLVPVWIEGFEGVMHESREWPRMVPRAGREVVVSFGRGVVTEEGQEDGQGVEGERDGGKGKEADEVSKGFGELRRQWRVLVEREMAIASLDAEGRGEEILMDRLKHSAEAMALREECTLLVREEILKLRRARGFDDEDPKARLVDTWKAEGGAATGLDAKKGGKMEDGSWVRDT